MARSMRRTSYRDLAYTGLFIFGILWFSYLIWGIAQKEERARHDVSQTKEQLAALDAREATLQNSLDDLHTERGQEAALRDTQGVAKPGEDVIIVVPAAVAAASTTPLSWWQQVLSWF